MHIDIQRDRARTLRRNMTSAELKLWRALRGRRLGGFRFNRQVEVGRYIADFACREMRVIVEVDGATHGDAANLRRDAKRTEFLEAAGYTVFRVGNQDVYENLLGVLDGLLVVLNGRHEDRTR